MSGPRQSGRGRRADPRLAEISGAPWTTIIRRQRFNSTHEEQERIRVRGGRGSKARLEGQGRAVDGLSMGARGPRGNRPPRGTTRTSRRAVDFPRRVGNETVNLCWKHGETAVRFWHRFDEGFAQRKPLP
jgi:hypothetical protein